MSEEVLIAFSLTLIAGLATGIGSLIAFFGHSTNTSFLSFSLGFSAGVMIYVSFVEILFKARTALIAEVGLQLGSNIAVLSFFCGMALIALIDYLVPHIENPHEMHSLEELRNGSIPADKRHLLRIGTMSAIAIAIHNFPEGLATFAAALQDPKLGATIAVAIAIHNIPEGIAVSVPLYYATGSRKKALFYSFLTGLAEPVGALIGYFLLIHYFNDLVLGVLFGGVAGIMVFISLDQLLPAAEKYGQHHTSIYGVVSGMVVIAVSILLFL